MATTKRIRLAIAAGIVGGTLIACGGGGDDAPAANGGATNIALSGTAAKGLMANADVTALPVNADGTVGSTALATGTTDASGHYTLSFAATKDQPYVIQVKARADGTTTHLDEVTGASQPLPAGFTMRALLVPDVTGSLTTSANVTPFSELAVAAAAKAAGGITKANADQARSTVRQLLGFDPAAVAVKAAGATGASEDENRQAILLLAVSTLAHDGALGCTSGTAGDQVKCVVDTLASGASTTSIKLETGTTDVSAALGTAVGTVLGDAELNGGVSPSTLATVTANLACTSNCAAAPVATVAVIDSAKALFTQLKSDWTAMFSRGGASAIAAGAANAQAWKFTQAMDSTKVPLAMAARDVGALLMGVDLYNDYKAGREPKNSRGRAPLSFGIETVATDTPLTATQFNAVGCTLYQDAATSIEATAPSNANFIGCRATSFVNIVGNVQTDWRHGFGLTPTGNGGFSYTTRTRKRVNNCVAGVCTTVTNDALQANAFSGTLSTTTDSTSGIAGFSVSGDLAAMLDGKTLVGDHASWTLSGTRTPDGAGGYADAITGTVATKDAAGVAIGTLGIKKGTLTIVAVRHDVLGRIVKPGSPQDAMPGGEDSDSGEFDLVWTTPAAEFEGTFSVTPGLWDKSGYQRIPASTTFTGALRNIEAGVTTEFLSGTLALTPGGYAAFDSTLSDSATNFYTRNIAFTGTITAPGRPVLALTLATSNTSFDDQPKTATLQYRTLVAGQPKTVVDVTGSRSTAGNMTWTFAEASSGLSLAWDENASQATLRKGSEVVGVIDAATKLITFSDHSVISIDLGL